MFRSFLSRIFRFSNLTFKSLIHLELIFVSEGRKWLLHSFTCFPCTVYWRDCLFSIEFSWLFLVKYEFIIYTWIYFWALDSVPLIYLFLCQYCFNYCGFIGLLKNQEMWCLLLCSFSSALPWLWRVFGLLWICHCFWKRNQSLI